MAIAVKVDSEDLPGLASILGLGGMPRQAADAPDPNEPPPIDPSMGGTDDPTAQPASSAQSDNQTVPDPTAASAEPAKNKLQSLREFLSPGGPPDPVVPVPPLQVPGQPQNAMPPADLAQSMAAGTAQINPTFREAHPVVSTLAKIALATGQGALTGSQYANAGEGFQAAQQAPIALAKAKAELAHTQATTEQMKSQVTLPNGLTVPFALAQKLYPTLLTEQGKDTRSQAGLDSKESIANQKNAIALRAKGLKPDPANPNGPPVALSRDEMSENEQATLDLKQSQQDAAAAKAELDRQKNNPNSPAYKAAAGRLAVAQKNADTAAGRLGIEAKKYQADYFGTDDKGNALPGAPTDDAGNPIGPRVANAGAASADRLKRGDLARNATQNANSIQRIVGSRPDLFGAISGRITNVQQMLGSDDPDIARLGVEVHNLALASNGAHGVRSAGAVEQTENELINHFKMGPNAVNAALDSMKDSLGTFTEDQKHGKRPVPSNAGTPKAQVQAAPPPGATNEVYAADGKTLIGHTVGNTYVPLPKK